MIHRKTISAAIAAALIMAAPMVQAMEAEEITAVVGARVLTAAGLEIDNGVILIKEGKIAAVGAAGDISVPAGARIIAGAGLVVTPG